MKVYEILAEAAADIIEDDAENRGDANLVTALEFLRNQAGSRLVPKVRADALINMVRKTGQSEFNMQALQDIYKSNDTVKNLIKEIKPDDAGVNYVYLTASENNPEMDVVGGEEEGASTGATTAPEKTLDQMADRALKKRS